MADDDQPADLCRIRESWWHALEAIKPYALGVLIFTGLLFELVIHYFLKISVVYTQFYYLIIVIAGFWYGRILAVCCLRARGEGIHDQRNEHPGRQPYGNNSDAIRHPPHSRRKHAEGGGDAEDQPKH